MKRFLFLTGIVVSVMASVAFTYEFVSENNYRLQDSDWVSLFNGRDLSGWKIFGNEQWYVEDGELICESGPEKKYGYLATEKVYKDFELKLEFKQESNGNSGVFFRSSLEGIKISGWQVEVAPKGHDTGGIYES